jgi:hypothetical protein
MPCGKSTLCLLGLCFLRRYKTYIFPNFNEHFEHHTRFSFNTSTERFALTSVNVAIRRDWGFLLIRKTTNIQYLSASTLNRFHELETNICTSLSFGHGIKAATAETN